MPIKEMDGPGEPIGEDDLSQLEQRLGVALPSPYRAFLLANNGGRPVPDAFPIPGGDDPEGGSLLDEFLPVTGKRTIEKAVRTFADRIPRGLLPIARDAGGNVICLGTQDEHYGRIYFWDHDSEEDEPTWTNVYPLASSFPAFLESFRDRPAP